MLYMCPMWPNFLTRLLKQVGNGNMFSSPVHFSKTLLKQVLSDICHSYGPCRQGVKSSPSKCAHGEMEA